MSASGTWNHEPTEFPVKGTSRQRLDFAMKYAELAPAERSWQPWLFNVADEHAELFVRKSPALEAIDPDGREAMIHCGVALHYLKLALKHFGCLGRVELFPELGRPTLVARIHCGLCPQGNEFERELFRAMTRSRVNPSPLGEPPVTQETLEALRAAVARERAWLEIAQSETTQRRLLDLSAAAELSPMRATVVRREFSLEVNVRPRPVRSGLATDAPFRSRISRWTKPLFSFKVRKGNLQPVTGSAPRETEFSTGTFGVLKTKTDDKQGWLAAGQAMARAILQAQALGVSWSFFNQALRNRDTRTELRTGIGHKGFGQAILRFGSNPFATIPVQSMPHPVTARVAA